MGSYVSWKPGTNGCCIRPRVVAGQPLTEQRFDSKPHKLGGWTKASNGCQRKCERCGWSESRPHEWGSWNKRNKDYCERYCKCCGHLQQKRHDWHGSASWRSCRSCNRSEVRR